MTSGQEMASAQTGAAAGVDAPDTGHLRIHGELSFASVPALQRAAAGHIERAASPLLIDLGAVQRVDSAGLALLVDWLRQGRRHGLEMRFTGMPDQLMAIARASGLDKLLPQDG